ncbi:MAG: Dam family site-specific DNA-(adenine-N6)-methyltransferase [Bryobacteraceae bacterium]|jgi:DNA adenine methylase
MKVIALWYDVTPERPILTNAPLSPTLPIALGSFRRGKPFLRWAGSKRKQVSRLASFWSPDHERYVEPFVGSACLFFEIAPKSAVLGDTNKELMEVYRVVRDEPERLYRRLCRIRRDLRTYCRWRGLKPQSLDRETRALRFLYLNRNCFNGIYRTNMDGDFNVPMGKRPGAYFSKEDLLECSTLLRRATLIPGDFAKTLEGVRAGDFVYLDPPYAVTSRRVFREYGKKTFNTADIPRLSECLTAIVKHDADFLVSYADCAEARALALEWNSVRLPVRRHVAGFAGARKRAYEWLISNRPIPAC